MKFQDDISMPHTRTHTNTHTHTYTHTQTHGQAETNMSPTFSTLFSVLQSMSVDIINVFDCHLMHWWYFYNYVLGLSSQDKI